MTYEQLLDRIISDGIAAANVDYANEPDKLRGAIDGFEACRGKLPTDLVALWKSAEKRAHERLIADAGDYWQWRCFMLEVEFVINVVSVGIVQQGGQPLLGWLPTANGTLKYAEIVGVRNGGSAP
jgi:hypothetical protein